MYDQRLPLPIGGQDPTRRYRRPWFASSRDRNRVLLLTAAVTLTVAGGLLGARQPVVSVELGKGAYTIGSIDLPAQGGGVYAGPQGAVVIDQSSAGTVRAGGSTMLHGVPAQGTCTVPAGGRSEHCSFSLGGRGLAADDARTAGGWHRIYSDGQAVDIALPAGTVPVPFPLGR